MVARPGERESKDCHFPMSQLPGHCFLKTKPWVVADTSGPHAGKSLRRMDAVHGWRQSDLLFSRSTDGGSHLVQSYQTETGRLRASRATIKRRALEGFFTAGPSAADGTPLTPSGTGRDGIMMAISREWRPQASAKESV